jgi:hypothetical protein
MRNHVETHLEIVSGMDVCVADVTCGVIDSRPERENLLIGDLKDSRLCSLASEHRLWRSQ